MTDTTASVDGGALPAVPQTHEPIARAGLLRQLARHGLRRQKASCIYFLNLRLRVQ